MGRVQQAGRSRPRRQEARPSRGRPGSVSSYRALSQRQCLGGRPGATPSGRSSAAMQPLMPMPQRTWTTWSGRSSVKPKRRSVSICTKMSGVPSPRVKNPNPRTLIEPLYPGLLPVALRRDLDVGALRQLGGVDRRALIHAENAESLQAPRPLEHLAVHARPFIGRLVAARSQAGDVQQHVGEPIVGHDEPVTLRYVEPFDGSGDLEHLDAGFTGHLRIERRPLFIRIVWRKLAVFLHHTKTPRLRWNNSRSRTIIGSPVGSDCPLETAPDGTSAPIANTCHSD